MNPYLEILAAGAIWGSAGVFIKLIDLPSTTVAFLRLGTAAIIIGFYLKIKHRPLIQKDDGVILFASLLNGIRSFLYFFAYSTTSIGNAVIILYTWPLFASFFGSLYLKEKLEPKKISLLFIAFIGVIVMFSGKTITFENKDFLGMGVMLISAIVYGLIVPIFKKELQKHTRAEVIYHQNIIGAFLFLPFIFINKPLPDVLQISTGITYSLLIGIGAYILFFNALRKISTLTASLLSYFEVVSAIVFGVIFFGEKITLNMIIGGFFILTASILVTQLDRKNEVLL